MARPKKVLMVTMPQHELAQMKHEIYNEGYRDGKKYILDNQVIDAPAIEMLAMVTNLGNANAQLTTTAARMLELCKRR